MKFHLIRCDAHRLDGVGRRNHHCPKMNASDWNVELDISSQPTRAIC